MLKKSQPLLSHLRDWSPALIAHILQFSLHAIMLTCKKNVVGLDYLVETASKERCILMLWHNRLTLAAYFAYRYARQFFYSAVVSTSRDGDILAAIADLYDHGSTIRIAQQSKIQGLREVIKYLKDGKNIIMMTPDGPRGPIYKIKPGIVIAAKSSEAHIIPFTWTIDRFWSLKTWDGLIIPKPFSKVTFIVGKPIKFDENMVNIESETVILQDVLTKLGQNSDE